jgi:uncharacterized protein (DUF2336 family)
LVLNWVFGTKKAVPKKGKSTKPAYEKAREIAAKGTTEQRTALAAHEDLEPEILYYFATDASPQVRRTVAENNGTPLQADIILAKDSDEDVRTELARKIGRMVPELNARENQRLAQMAIEILEVLAKDELPRVRAVIAEELKHARNVPPAMVRRLAEDLEDIVAVPILEYSPLLSEADLLEIVARGMRTKGLVAIARRALLAAPVANAIVRRNDATATGALLENRSANIDSNSYEAIADKAEMNKGWHNAMVYRDDLPSRVILRIAAFVNAALMEALMDRHHKDKDVLEGLRKTVRARIDKGDLPDSKWSSTVTIENETSDYLDPAERRAKDDQAAGTLGESMLAGALKQKDFAYVKYGLLELSGLPSKTFNQMLGTKQAKAILAIAWKAGVSARFAERLQIELVGLQKDQLIKGRPDGRYPMSDSDLDWYVESFSV